MLRRALVSADDAAKLLRHSTALLVPEIIQPAPERLTVAITALCNLRCVGCRYGRDFMPSAQLPAEVVRDLLSDAAAAGFPTVRLYGGEPLLHARLPDFIEHSLSVGMKPVITTNGILLKDKISALYSAGLRSITLGYYGFADEYDQYVGRNGAFSRLERSVAAVRDRYGLNVDLQINYLLTRQTCSVELLHTAWNFAKQYRMSFQVDLVHYSLPYFTEGPDRLLQFNESDREKLKSVTQELLRLKAADSTMFLEPASSIRSLPDWALKQSDMTIPCDAYKMLWIGADGTVQLCYAAFPLGNLHQTRLRDIFSSPEHKRSCHEAFNLQCPRCHCERASRIQSHLPSRIRYGGLFQGTTLPTNGRLEQPPLQFPIIH